MRLSKKLLVAAITATFASVSQGVYAEEIETTAPATDVTVVSAPVEDAAVAVTADATATPVLTEEEVTTGKKGSKVDVCHNGHVINIAQAALAAHLAHGDTEGECPPPPPAPVVDEPVPVTDPVVVDPVPVTDPVVDPIVVDPIATDPVVEPVPVVEDPATTTDPVPVVEEPVATDPVVEPVLVEEVPVEEVPVVEPVVEAPVAEEVPAAETVVEETTVEDSPAEEVVAEDPRVIEDMPPADEVEAVTPEPTQEEIGAQLLVEAETLTEGALKEGFLVLPEVQVTVFGMTISYAVVLEARVLEDGTTQLAIAGVKEVEAREGVASATYSLAEGQTSIPVVNVTVAPEEGAVETAATTVPYYDVVLAVSNVEPLEFVIQSYRETADEVVAEEATAPVEESTEEVVSTEEITEEVTPVVETEVTEEVASTDEEVASVEEEVVP